MKKKDIRIVFMGTPAFAVVSLKLLISKEFSIVGVVTNPDKKAGRGKKIRFSPVKIFAEKMGIPVLQPAKFTSSQFLKQLKLWKADLHVVVAFKILPEVVWSMPRFGTINLHASYLPQYRGAAPINWAIINGEKETGISTFLLQKKVDAGNILFRKKVKIENEDTAETLHNKLAGEGADLLIKTIKAIYSKKCNAIPQNDLVDDKTKLKKAPKIFKENCRINWNDGVKNIYNHIRGLSPHPGSWAKIKDNKEDSFTLKVFSVQKIFKAHDLKTGKIVSDYKNFLHVAVLNGFISIVELQLQGRKRMEIKEFLNGFPIKNFKFL